MAAKNSITNDFLTGIRDVDRNILLQLPYQGLLAVCQTNKYANNLCSDDGLWKSKLLQGFPEAVKPEGSTWREFYSVIARHIENPSLISEALNLDPYQGYVQYVTETDVIRDSEAFQSISNLLDKVIRRKDYEMIDYLFGINIPEVYPETTLFDYNKILLAAIETGLDNIAEDILQLVRSDPIHTTIGSFGHPLRPIRFTKGIYVALGKQNNQKLLQEVIETINTGYNTDLRFSFLRGLILGHHNKEAMPLIQEIFQKTYEDSYDNNLSHDSFKLLDYALISNNQEIVDFVRSFNEIDLLELKELYLKYGYYDQAEAVPVDLPPETVVDALLYSDPHQAIRYYYENKVSEVIQYSQTIDPDILEFYFKLSATGSIDSDISNWLDINQVNPVMFADILDTQLVTTSGQISALIRRAINRGRYDLVVPNLDKVSREHYDDIMKASFRNGYYDLGLYFLKKSLERDFQDFTDTFKESLSEIPTNTIDTYLLVEYLKKLNLSYEEYIELNMYDVGILKFRT